jgi:CHAD domain-containing protein
MSVQSGRSWFLDRPVAQAGSASRSNTSAGRVKLTMLLTHEPHSTESAVDEIAPADVCSSDPAGAAIRAALAEGYHWVRENESKAREGDPRGVHHLRTTTRRLRSSLALFRGLIDADWCEKLGEELKWLAGHLGAVRDLDVLIARLRESASSKAVSTSLEPFFEALEARRTAALEALDQALIGDRYRLLTATLAEAVAGVPLTDAAWEPCRTALPRLVVEAWRPLRRAGRALESDDADEEFHEVRKRAKRARYAAEAVANALDATAARAANAFAQRAKAVQDVLGAHQDAVLASGEILTATSLRHADGPFQFAAGRLYEHEQHVASGSRAEFVACWRSFDRKKLRRWLHV